MKKYRFKEEHLRFWFPLVLGSFTYFSNIIITQDFNFLVRGFVSAIIQILLVFETFRFIGLKINTGKVVHIKNKKKLLSVFLLSLLISLAIGTVFYTAYKYLFTVVRPRFSDVTFVYFFVNAFFIFNFNIFALLFYMSWDLFKDWKSEFMEKEELKKENLVSQYSALQNQLNPHFLFNNFNTLYHLINENPKIASEYLLELSELYRYILNASSKELIELDKELEIIDSYFFMLKKRFGENLLLEIDIKHPDRYCLPVLSIQILVENAVKHNAFDDDHQLIIEITEKESYLEVKNNLYPKNIEYSSGIGLSNLNKRYTLLNKSKLEIRKHEQYFLVKLPLFDKTNNTLNQN